MVFQFREEDVIGGNEFLVQAYLSFEDLQFQLSFGRE